MEFEYISKPAHFKGHASGYGEIDVDGEIDEEGTFWFTLPAPDDGLAYDVPVDECYGEFTEQEQS